MAPNPIMIPRKRVPRSSLNAWPARDRPASTTTSWITILLATAIALTTSWARRWLYSGAAIQSFLLIHGSAKGDRVISDVPLWTLLATLNLVYAICSTSWLLNGLFVSVCYVMIFLTSLFQSRSVANLARKVLRKALGGNPHLVMDKLALFNLPALEIDTDVDGLFVIRGLTISFSSLTVVAHGIELGT